MTGRLQKTIHTDRLNQKKNNKMNNKLILLSKTSGVSSFGALSGIKKSLDTRRVGHTGTLDSFADGLLVVLTGRLTRLVEHITALDKEYTGIFVFGKETDTLDCQGKVIKTADSPSKEKILNLLPGFTGKISQIPPAFSAVHIDGKRAYNLAREGKTPELKSREVFIKNFELIDFFRDDRENLSYGLFKIQCSKGTYIRSLARDLAVMAGSCGYVLRLRRNRVGAFKLENSVFCEYLPDWDKKTLKETLIGFKSGESAALPPDLDKLSLIRQKALDFTREIAEMCGFYVANLKENNFKVFFNGGRLTCEDFYVADSGILPGFYGDVKRKTAVYYRDSFAGLGEFDGKGNFKYIFVLPKEDFGEAD